MIADPLWRWWNFQMSYIYIVKLYIVIIDVFKYWFFPAQFLQTLERSYLLKLNGKSKLADEKVQLLPSL